MDENPFQDHELVKVYLVRIGKVDELVDGKNGLIRRSAGVALAWVLKCPQKHYIPYFRSLSVN